METAKARAEKYAKRETNCKALIQTCSGDFGKLRVIDMKQIYEWKLGKKPTGLKKEEILTAVVAANNNPPVGAVYWTAEDDAVLKGIKEKEIKIADTAVGKKMAEDLRKVANTAKTITNERMEIARAHLSPEEIKTLEEAQEMWPCEE
mmetsp:Transcript_2532/g.6722  ORF Transcript_2532/g.6722 Transcript_2532/m.6722 type:complete len:148 (-) Transcript_2532:163-606(-)